MVKYLFNYPVIDWYEKELQLMGQSLGEYVASMKLDGIEQLIYDNNMNVSATSSEHRSIVQLRTSDIDRCTATYV